VLFLINTERRAFSLRPMSSFSDRYASFVSFVHSSPDTRLT